MRDETSLGMNFISCPSLYFKNRSLISENDHLYSKIIKYHCLNFN